MLAIENVSPIHGLSTERHQVIEDSKILGGGGFSQLRELDGDRVLKLTCCEATHRLFDALQGDAVATRARRHLPQVFEAWGECATDPDRMLYRGYVLERLYTPKELEAKFSLSLGPTGARAADWLGQLQRRQFAEEALLGATQERFTREGVPGWESAVKISTARIDDERGETRDSFAFLGAFCYKQRIELDLRTAGNILFGPDLRLVLADPVTKYIPVQ